MIDLEHRLASWYARQDWRENLMEAALMIGVLISFIPVVVIGLLMIFGE